MRDPFSVDYDNLTEVIRFAKELAKGSKVPQLVIKHPDRANYNITMQQPKDGAVIIWRSDRPLSGDEDRHKL